MHFLLHCLISPGLVTFLKGLRLEQQDGGDVNAQLLAAAGLLLTCLHLLSLVISNLGIPPPHAGEVTAVLS